MIMPNQIELLRPRVVRGLGQTTQQTAADSPSTTTGTAVFNWTQLIAPAVQTLAFLADDGFDVEASLDRFLDITLQDIARAGQPTPVPVQPTRRLPRLLLPAAAIAAAGGAAFLIAR